MSFYDDNWYDERWQSMPLTMRKIASDTIKKAIPEEDQELIRRKHAEYGHAWIHHLIDVPEEERAKMDALLPEENQTDEYRWPATMSAHHGFGTSIRNLLRSKYGAGIKDDDLPDAPYEDGMMVKNWDDYYVQAIEAAVEVREL